MEKYYISSNRPQMNLKSPQSLSIWPNCVSTRSGLFILKIATQILLKLTSTVAPGPQTPPHYDPMNIIHSCSKPPTRKPEIQTIKLGHVGYNVRPPATTAKLVQITPISLWFMVLITIVFLVFINQLTSLGGTILHGYFPIYRSFFPRFPSLGQQLFMRTKWCWNMHTNICPKKIT